ncbi:hypothetical protein BCV69DRAFT_112964 [Microstroma glucosiphilum]|uniref:Uncharacterized protein n=1 Tax=Pseudomicrostroma glucosiphilum TaxID=1684307 RepID=A0A316UEB4_9BASI|nr:hypothetical protein BCV69DRAFT_112964 [Pseudomicrostroma glucosiphilum]PWN23248.1 hypothetical protein BCV69DRAFT_112964 [Pseudomicrostroma glucosiphilum]
MRRRRRSSRRRNGRTPGLQPPTHTSHFTEEMHTTFGSGVSIHDAATCKSVSHRPRIPVMGHTSPTSTRLQRHAGRGVLLLLVLILIGIVDCAAR